MHPALKGATPKPNTLASGALGRRLLTEKTAFTWHSEIPPTLGYGRTFSFKFTLETAPFGAVAVTTNGYSPGFVAVPPGDFGKLLHADIPTAIRTRTPNDRAPMSLRN